MRKGACWGAGRGGLHWLAPVPRRICASSTPGRRPSGSTGSPLKGLDITGGSVGIGKETARKLAAEGVSVVIAARTLSTLEAAADQRVAEIIRSIAFTALTP